MTPADKPMDRSRALRLARYVIEGYEHFGWFGRHSNELQLARAVLEMDEELRKAAESGKEKSR